MGKSTKKSTKVDAAPAVTPPTKSAKKGKREAEEAIVKQASAKKQRRDVGTEQAVEKRKSEVKTLKKTYKKEKTSSSEDTSEEEQKVKVASKKGGIPAKPPVKESSGDDSSSDEESPVKPVVSLKKQPVAASKNGTGKKGKLPSSSESLKDSDSEEDENPKSKVAVPSKKLPVASAKNGLLAAPKKKVESSDDSESDDSSSSDDDKKVTPATQEKKPPTVPQKVDDSSDSSSDSSSDEDNEEVAAATKTMESSDSSSDSESEEVVAPATKVLPSKMPSSATETKESKQKKADLKEADSDDSSSDDSVDEEPQRKKTKAQPTVTPNAGQPSAKATQKVDSHDDESSDDSSDESSEDEPAKAQLVKKPTPVPKKGSTSDEESENDSSSEDDTSEEEEEQPSKTPKKNEGDVEMVDAVGKSGKKAPQTPVTPQVQTAGSKTLFVGNLSFSVEQADVENFFKDAGEVVDIRFAADKEGAFRGYGHVEFATVEAAQKALEWNGQELLGRRVRLDVAQERGSYTPFSGKERNSYQKEGRAQGQTIFVRGFDKSSGEDQVRSALEEHFGTCGEISRVSIPKEYGAEELKGIAYIDFTDSDSFNKALELSGSELEGYTLMVEEAKPRDNAGRSGGRSGGRDGGGRFGSRDGGGRFGGRGGRFSEGDLIVQKIATDSLSILEQTFTFDSVADTESKQLDIFELVGAPLVENCLAGFNSSVFAYGQTGSGKTYTMWGPANALFEENLSTDQQGLTPRVFERLFTRISEEQNKHADMQLMYQCRCSFLEIYNEQITDLLDLSQKNLQIREDVKAGVYVENLTEECVCTMKDVTKLLIKGLSNRRTGATSINAESSRSHSVFTCFVESRCKSAADGLSCFKTSRINLVDLAGSERQKLTGAAGERLKEAGNINRSLSQLGNLINILAEVSQTGKQRHIPYRDSRLTFLLQESLGGNAKLAMVCAISPVQSCKSETLSTLRFAQRAKAIKNTAVVNEVMQDDVNFLREVIRQLKDELLRMKANGNQTDPNGGYSTGWNARRSLNLLKFSLNRPMTFPHAEDDNDEEMEIVEEADHVGVQSADSEANNVVDVSNLETAKLDLEDVACKEGTSEEPRAKISESACIENHGSKDTDVIMEEEMSYQIDKHEIITVDHGEPLTYIPDFSKANVLNYHNHAEGNHKDSCGQPSQECLTSSVSNLLNEESPSKQVGVSPTQIFSKSPGQDSADYVAIDLSNTSPNGSVNHVAPSNLSLVPSEVSPVLKSPTPSVSPRVNSNNRKSLRNSSIVTPSQKDLRDDDKLGSEAVRMSFAKASNSSSLNSQTTQTNRSCFLPTEYLASSLHYGLEVIDSHRQSSALRRSSFRFSYKPADIKPILPIDKVDMGVQTLSQDNELQEEPLVFLCCKCKSGNSHQDLKDANDPSNMQLVPVDGSESVDKSKKLVPKAVEKVLAGAIRREMALEDFSAKQTSEIMYLNRLVQQYKHERECNAIIGRTREDKIVRLESLMDGILNTEEFREDELVSLKNEHDLLKEQYENHPEVLRTKIELKRVQDEVERYRNFFDMGERDVLLDEIQDLRSQLQYYTDSAPKSAQKQSPLLQLTYPYEPSAAPLLCTIPESAAESAEQKLEQERICWIDAESKWISLAEELKIELEASRSLAEKQKQELDLEKKCSEELKDAMQMAMEGHARMLEQYAELQEKHIQMLARHRKIRDGIDDVKKAAAKAGVRGAESKFINALAAEISALKVEREKERRYFKDENKGLQSQLRDTAEAVQAAGELLVRLKEAEEAVAASQKRAVEAELETENAYKQIDKLKKRYEKEIVSLNQLLAESRLPKESIRPACDDSDVVKYDAGESPNVESHQRWQEGFQPFHNVEGGEISKLAEPSNWFSGYDRCNI